MQLSGGRYYVLDECGAALPIDDLIAWATWFETADRTVARTEIGDVLVSTVFLALDHNWGPGLPELWETMIFGGAHDEEQWRYSSRADAVAGHAAAVALVNGE
jgi:hypothetical protein